MGDQFELIKKLEAEAGFKFSKRFKITMITASVLSTIILMFIAAATMAKHKDIVSVLFIILIILWISVLVVLLYDVLKHLRYRWGMRMVMVDDPNQKCGSLPQNAINAKRQGCKFRKPTKKERVEWRLNKIDRVNDIPFLTEAENNNMRLNHPATPMEEFNKIRDKQERRKKSYT